MGGRDKNVQVLICLAKVLKKQNSTKYKKQVFKSNWIKSCQKYATTESQKQCYGIYSNFENWGYTLHLKAMQSID